MGNGVEAYSRITYDFLPCQVERGEWEGPVVVDRDPSYGPEILVEVEEARCSSHPAKLPKGPAGVHVMAATASPP